MTDLDGVGELRATRYEVTDRVATVTLHRPERGNAWTGRMNAEYRACLSTADRDDAVRAIVVTGAGRAFCVGADDEALEGHAARGAYDPGTPPVMALPGEHHDGRFEAEFAYHFAVRKPVIAKLNGAAAGVGFALACYCDVRFAALGAKLTTAHGPLGLPAEFGLSWLLPRLVGTSRAAELLLSSRVVLAEEAQAIGLVHRAVARQDLDTVVDAYVARLVTGVAPSSLRSTKEQLYGDLHRGVDESLADADRRLREMMGSGDFKAGVAALRERRPPRF